MAYGVNGLVGLVALKVVEQESRLGQDHATNLLRAVMEPLAQELVVRIRHATHNVVVRHKFITTTFE